MRQRIARFGAAKPQAPVLDPLFKVIRAMGFKISLTPLDASS
jgi:hypothetical protein